MPTPPFTGEDVLAGSPVSSRPFSEGTFDAQSEPIPFVGIDDPSFQEDLFPFLDAIPFFKEQQDRRPFGAAGDPRTEALLSSASNGNGFSPLGQTISDLGQRTIDASQDPLEQIYGSTQVISSPSANVPSDGGDINIGDFAGRHRNNDHFNPIDTIYKVFQDDRPVATATQPSTITDNFNGLPSPEQPVADAQTDRLRFSNALL